jgi:thiol-disulfide isomerase/thioredoxin
MMKFTSMKSIRVLFCLALIMAVSCTSKSRKAQEKSQANESEYRFSVPKIPGMISDPRLQAAWLAEHYWDNFDFRDSSDPERKKFISEAFADYLMILGEVEPMKAGVSVRSLMEKASDNKKLTIYYADRAEQFLYNPNSPIRNELLYEEFLKGVLACKSVEPGRKAHFQDQFDFAQKNKPGNKATDFEYTLKDGRRSSLYQTPGKLIMIYFHNPGCHECAATRDRIVNSQIIQELKTKGLLKILAVYPDKDLDLWNKHNAELPGTWINGYDKETIIQDKQLYDLKAIPTIYLLDDGKTVLLRDPTFEQFEKYLSGYSTLAAGR